ncbi:ABC transporter substrate-binding protein [Jiangella alba]|uniref:Carbohydrate ABC transporter substrate-binding protein, CUT1 family n=1 Tax=Jiangella alba TaxID=561176 RepID=A0A1H5JBD3_9ACTN|nr:sugar ABC transporter substrate-binding protein [Jiangella alba]SEE49774.1 carbohydrate ABC transporter substrate-binding protein, CUT1 family [Jiangella alba]
MKRIPTRLALAAAAATLFALAGCSGTDTADSAGSAASSDTEAEITYAIWDKNQVEAIEQNIADFNEEYPNITVKIDVTPWEQYWTKLQTQASSSTLPDLFWMNGPNFQLYASNDQLEPVDSIIEASDLDPANYPEALNELYSFDGAQYGVPKDFDTIALWYNTEILERAGVEAPTADWTWDDFRAAAKQISTTLGGEGIYGVAPWLTNGQSAYYNTILQAGGEIISSDGASSGFDSPEAIAGLQLWADLIADGSSPTLQQLSDTDALAYFSNGKAGLYWSGTWDVAPLAESAVADKIVVAPLPQDQRRATVIHGLANVVSADSANKAAAQAFQAFLGSQQAQQTQAEMGAANPAFNDTQAAFVNSVPGFNLQVFLDAAADYSFPYPVSQNTSAWTQLEAELLPQAFSGERPVAEVAQELAEKMNEELADE